MKSIKEITKLRDLMQERFEKGHTALNDVIMVADAFEVCNTLNWVLDEHSGIPETLDQAGITLA